MTGLPTPQPCLPSTKETLDRRPGARMLTTSVIYDFTFSLHTHVEGRVSFTSEAKTLRV